MTSRLQGLPRRTGLVILGLLVGLAMLGSPTVSRGTAVEALVQVSSAPSIDAGRASTSMIPRTPPRFSGVTTYRDPEGRFSIRYPSDWSLEVYEGAADEVEGIILRPNSEDPQTYFCVWVRDLGESVVAEDVAEIRAGILEQLSGLQGIRIDAFTEALLDNLIRLEVVYTFDSSDQVDGESVATHKRKVWTLYADRLGYQLTWQGSSIEEYEYWLATANYSFAFFQLPLSVWAATDRGT